MLVSSGSYCHLDVVFDALNYSAYNIILKDQFILIPIFPLEFEMTPIS